MYNIEGIIGAKPNDYPPGGFRNRMINICRNHYRDKRALVFAFIVYDRRHAQIAKILKDPDYWAALDGVSGLILSAFSLRLPSATLTKDQNQAKQALGGIRDCLCEFVGCDALNEGPGVLFFQISENSVIDSCSVRLYEKKQEDSYLEMREILEEAVKSLSSVDDQYRGNLQEVFDLLNNAISRSNSEL